MTTTAIADALAGVLEGVSASLRKEGADIQVDIDDQSRRVRIKLVRTRIVCEDCLLTAEQVQRRVRRTLAQSGAGAGYDVQTDWS